MDSQNARDTIILARRHREKLLGDKYRPGFHFCDPEDVGIPGDSNGAFYANGRYHLMYLYENRDEGFCWGHVSSADLLHWRWHPDALRPDGTSRGIFSGGAFVDDDGTAWLSFWGLEREGNRGGIRLARSRDITGHYSAWEMLPGFIIPSDEPGITCRQTNDETAYIGSADPSNIWKDGDWYYIETGNLCILQKFRHFEDGGLTDGGRAVIDENTPAQYRGDWVDLFRSKNLKQWEYVHRFYHRGCDPDMPDDSEDDMCPSFLPLPLSPDGGAPSGKYLQLFIAHNRGAQYYIGDYDRENQCFMPQAHGRFSRADNLNFAPEALIDGNGRQISWQWLLENHDPFKMVGDGWDGIFTLPRTLWLREYGTLGIAPVGELRSLRYNERDSLSGTLPSMCEITASYPAGMTEKTGVRVLMSADGTAADVYYDPTTHGLCISCSVRTSRKAFESLPMTLADGEPLALDIFLDNGLIEVFANDRQAVVRRAFPANPAVTGAEIIGVKPDSLKVYEIMPTNMF